MPERKIWELRNQIICTILGLTFDDNGLTRIFKKLKLNNGQINPYKMHGKLVQACATQNKTSRQLDKILSEKFEQYKERVRRIPQQEVYKYIINGELKDIPLPALIWFTVRNQHEEIQNIEAMVFAAVHMYEHRASRFYDTLRITIPDGKPDNVIMELKEINRSNEKLQTTCRRLTLKKEQLKSEFESLKEEKSRVITALEEQKQLNIQLKSDFDKVNGEDTLKHINDLTKKINFLTKEVKTLSSELLERKRMDDDISSELIYIDPLSEHEIKENDGIENLNGLKMAYIGGVESLRVHYKETIESYGGTFQYHCGRCLQGKKEIENLVDKTDLVFCPVDINSQKACKYVKKACKLKNKTCCFLRSSGLSMLIKELENVSKPEVLN